MQIMLVVVGLYFLGGGLRIVAYLLDGPPQTRAVAAICALISLLALCGCLVGFRRKYRISLFLVSAGLLLSAPVVILRTYGFTNPFFLSLRFWFSYIPEGSSNPSLVIGLDLLPLVLFLIFAWTCRQFLTLGEKDNLFQLTGMVIGAALCAIVLGYLAGVAGFAAGGLGGLLGGALVTGAVIGVMRRKRQTSPKTDSQTI